MADWASATIAVVGALSGVALGQNWTGRRERKLERQREERRQLDRRTEAYRDLYASLTAWMRELIIWGENLEYQEGRIPDEDRIRLLNSESRQKLAMVELICPFEQMTLARAAFDKLVTFDRHLIDREYEHEHQTTTEARDAYTALNLLHGGMRKDIDTANRALTS